MIGGNKHGANLEGAQTFGYVGRLITVIKSTIAENALCL